jgi:Protein of unknown function (DUF974)
MAQPGAVAAHPLTFRVMRLTASTPSRRPTLPFVCSRPEEQAASVYPDAFLRDAPACEGEGAPASMGTICILPSSFGSIYASETFRSFISTYNFSGRMVRAVTVSIEIQTSSQRRISLVTTRIAANLPVSEAVSHVVSCSLPELGVHVLICSASYMDRTGTPRTLRQLFRFNVLPPLEPFVNVVPLLRRRALIPLSEGEGSSSSACSARSTPMAQFLIDLRILNTMPAPVYITSARIEAAPGYVIVKSLLRSDDPAAPDAQIEAGRGRATVAEAIDLAFEGRDCEADPCVSATFGDEKAPPLRGASTGVGDTRNFLFYVARPLEASERSVDVAPSPSGTLDRSNSTSEGLHLSGAATRSRSPAHEASPAPSASISRRDAIGNRSQMTRANSTHPLGARQDEASAPGRRRQIGFFSLRWHSGAGEHGQMDNVIAAFEPVSRAASIELRIDAVPQDIRVQVPFAARCIARNNTLRSVRLYLQVRRDLVGEIVPVGISGVSLGEVGPESNAECLVNLIALTRGKHSLSGVRVVDVDSRQTYNADAPLITVL